MKEFERQREEINKLNTHRGKEDIRSHK